MLVSIPHYCFDACDLSSGFLVSSRPNRMPISRETLTTVLGNITDGARVVLVGSSAGGVAAFNVASWLLDTFEQVKK